jgi:hypothetical protein
MNSSEANTVKRVGTKTRTRWSKTDPTWPVAVLSLAALLPSATQAQRPGFNYDEAKVPTYQLPGVLELADGTTVEDPQQWRRLRRPQLVALFEQHVYGCMPATLPINAVDLESEDTAALDGKAYRREVAIHLTRGDAKAELHVLLYLPVDTKINRPVPLFLGCNFQGNHTLHPTEPIRLAQVWDASRPDAPRAADESTRGAKSDRWPIETILDRGYGVATLYYGDIDPDFDDGFKNGVHALYPELQQRSDNWSSIGAWAWGLSRVLDYLETEPLIDPRRVAVIGHSRLGKTALWAGAQDERFALVISNNSGCGGAALARREFGETVKRINTAFPHWFCSNHKHYGDKVNELPVDQHQLLALIAPRPVYVASASEDLWADPRGEFLSCVEADPVYQLMETAGLPSHEFPAAGKPIHGRIGYHLREGEHDLTPYDWQQYLDFADRHLRERL